MRLEPYKYVGVDMEEILTHINGYELDLDHISEYRLGLIHYEDIEVRYRPIWVYIGYV